MGNASSSEERAITTNAYDDDDDDGDYNDCDYLRFVPLSYQGLCG